MGVVDAMLWIRRRCEDGTVAANFQLAESSHFGNPPPVQWACGCNNVHKQTRIRVRACVTCVGVRISTELFAKTSRIFGGDRV